MPERALLAVVDADDAAEDRRSASKTALPSRGADAGRLSVCEFSEGRDPIGGVSGFLRALGPFFRDTKLIEESMYWLGIFRR